MMNEIQKKAIENTIKQWEAMLRMANEQDFNYACISGGYIQYLKKKFCDTYNINMESAHNCYLCQATLDGNEVVHCELCPAKKLQYAKTKVLECWIKEFKNCVFSETFAELKTNMQKFIDKLKTLLED